MRVTEFLNLDEAAVGKAIHDVVQSIRRDSPGRDHIRVADGQSPTGRLLNALLERMAARQAQYGSQVGAAHGLMLAFRAGAAYGRRVPDPEAHS